MRASAQCLLGQCDGLLFQLVCHLYGITFILSEVAFCHS